MDEILIEDKKYISSKRAAKITGYAKDYIGQLCREGRVSARLVGRSWYVLETAIQDHRFGNQEVELKEPMNETKEVPEVHAPIISSEPESPKYEASPIEILPTITRLQDEQSAYSEDAEEVDISDSWREWFDRIKSTETSSAPDVTEIADAEKEVIKEDVEVKETATVENIEEEKPVEIPIHAVYRQPPQELLPHNTNLEPDEPSVEEPVQQSRQESRPKRNGVGVRVIQVCGMTIALIIFTLAVIGSGYLDEYIISNSQAQVIAGVALYSK